MTRPDHRIPARSPGTAWAGNRMPGTAPGRLTPA
jgi:hypothetical protein